MNIGLIPVEADYIEHIRTLYNLLLERTPQQSISHKVMPTFNEHWDFVASNPYQAWYLIGVGRDEIVGSVYLTQHNEIGIFLFKRYIGLGYAKTAVKQLMKKHKGPYLANVNPENQASREFFERLGGKLIQVTYELG